MGICKTDICCPSIDFGQVNLKCFIQFYPIGIDNIYGNGFSLLTGSKCQGTALCLVVFSIECRLVRGCIIDTDGDADRLIQRDCNLCDSR